MLAVIKVFSDVRSCDRTGSTTRIKCREFRMASAHSSLTAPACRTVGSTSRLSDASASPRGFDVQPRLLFFNRIGHDRPSQGIDQTGIDPANGLLLGLAAGGLGQNPSFQDRLFLKTGGQASAGFILIFAQTRQRSQRRFVVPNKVLKDEL